MQSMRSRKIPISDLRSIINDLALLEPDLTLSSTIDFDFLKFFHDLSFKRHFNILGESK